MTERIEELRSQLATQCVVVRHCEDALRDAENRRKAMASELLWHRTGIGVGAVVRAPSGTLYKVARVKPWSDHGVVEVYGHKATTSGGWCARQHYIGCSGSLEVIEPAPEPES